MDTNDAGNSVLVFTAHPAMIIDDQGLFKAVVFTRRVEDAADGPRYDATLQLIRVGGSLAAKVVSIAPRTGTSISIIVH